MSQVYTMITGATGVLGGAFARLAAENAENLILTGRSEEKLLSLKEKLQRLNGTADIRIFAANLENEGDRAAMIAQIEREALRIGRLINVAGADIQKPFCEYSQEKLLFQCRVNFEAAAAMALFATGQRAETLEIVNISSVSGIYPMPYFAVYSATKGALTSFSVALREEMKGRNVKVTAVLPGAMPTREDVRAQIAGQGLWGKFAAKEVDFVAKKSLSAVKKNKRKLIPGFANKLMNTGTKLLPMSLKLKFIAKRWSKISKDAF